MSGCHKCEHAAAIAAGKYADMDWEQTPCSTCDVMRGADYPFPYDENQSAAVASTPVEEPAEDHLPVTVLRELVFALLRLRPEVRDVVAWRYAGMRYDDIALIQGVTPQCVEKRHRRAMAQWPELEALFVEKMEKRKRRRVGAKRRAV